ncbi:hypothetical protein [Protofrankia symbiont of Coriaria ruscifolia]|uniref:hypothetical protein n=1 Tax=Protofrankia symbiont of Coriaria ruscifolia TaxID=1306542 RepID=UPI0010417C65|nr:hypothetical protein [Protofrankia symbiont of Coriaria ruscifolia]
MSDTTVWCGVLIEESLDGPALLEEVNVVGSSAVLLEEEAERGEVTFRRVEVPEASVDAVVAKAARSIKDAWYLHLVKGDQMKVVFRGKVFTLIRGDEDALRAAVAYGIRRHGIRRAQLGLARLFDQPFGGDRIRDRLPDGSQDDLENHSGA